MRPLSRLLVGLPALVLAACSSSDDTMGPGGPEPVTPPVIEDFSIADADGIITHGDYTALRWTAPGAAEIAILPIVGQGLNPEGGSVSIRPYEPTTYVITVRNSAGTVSDSVHVDIRYRPGVYVKSTGDDGAAGTDISTPVATLAEALSRTSAGGTIFLAAGTYTDPLVIQGAHVSVYGGLDPVSFFEGDPPELYTSTVRPTAGIPLSVRETLGIMEISRIRFDSFDTEAVAAEVVDGQVRLLGCTFDARTSSVAPAAGVAAALRVESTGLGTNVEARGCRFLGPRFVSVPETRGVSIVQGPGALPADVLLANCFIDSGKGQTRAAGVWVDTSGNVRIGMNTIGAESAGAGLDQDTPAAIRIERGAPFIGGNILFTRGGGGQRWGVQETTALGNPASLEGNLFISVGGTPYDNFDGLDPTTELQLAQPQYTIDPSDVVGDNRLVSSLSISQIVVNVDGQDFHLKPVAPGVPNPAVDAAATWVGKVEYGAVDDDIDGDNRPSFGNLWDLGADESN